MNKEAFTGTPSQKKDKEALNLLIVDDHDLTVRGLSIVIEKAHRQDGLPEFRVDSSTSCREGLEKFKLHKELGQPYDLVILDIQLPSAPEHQLYNGEDLGTLFKELHPAIKIIVLTNLEDNQRLLGLLKHLEPQGLILKSEVTEKNLHRALEDVLNDRLYYSQTVVKLLRNRQMADISLSKEERQLLHLLSQGHSTAEIAEALPWSMSKIEKKKKELREKLGVERKSVVALLKKAKELGFL